MSDNEQNNNDNTSSEESTETQEIPTQIKEVINKQSSALNEQASKIESLEKTMHSELSDMRLSLEHSAEIGANKAIEKSLGIIQQQQAQTQPNQPQAGTPGQTHTANPMNLLSDLQPETINRAADVILTKLLGPDEDSGGLGGIMLSNKKRFDKWVDILVTRVLNKAISISLAEHEDLINDSTNRALKDVSSNPLHSE